MRSIVQCNFQLIEQKRMLEKTSIGVLEILTPASLNAIAKWIAGCEYHRDRKCLGRLGRHIKILYFVLPHQAALGVKWSHCKLHGSLAYSKAVYLFQLPY